MKSDSTAKFGKMFALEKNVKKIGKNVKKNVAEHKG